MDWQMVSAIGSCACALATFIAAFIALWLGLRQVKAKVVARGYFKELPGYKVLESHPNGFVIDCLNVGNQPVYIAYVLEGPRYKMGLRGLLAWAKSLKKHNVGLLGVASPSIRVRRYWDGIPIGDSVCVEPGKMKSIALPFTLLLQSQEERFALGFFSANRPLRLYLVDISGRRFKVDSGATPESFLSERTCRMTKVSRITGEPIDA